MNRLAEETSPYLLQHASNPVDWYPWGEEALARARDEDRPILLSIGYAACHWCHVMAHESFEDPVTAELMNERFVNVKVDREERPDVDAIYMDAVVALTGQGGWPLTAFLTAEGEPFLGGTYFPPEPRHGMPAFRQLLVAVSDLYRERREEVAERASVLIGAPRAGGRGRPVSGAADRVAAGRGDAAARRAGRPGVGRVRPRAEVPAGLGDRAAAPARRGRSGCEDPRRDGGGRHVRPGRRRLPSLLGRRALARAALREDALRQRAARPGLPARLARDRQRRATARSRRRHSTSWCGSCGSTGGGFASSQDADTDGVEGLTYTWAPGEGAPEELFEPFEGGRFVLRGELDEEARARLLEVRSQRPQPARDDKAIASWNGLALAALAEGGRRLARADLVAEAEALGAFLLGPLSGEDGRLYRSLRAGRVSGFGFLDDYANVANGLYELHVATGELRWLEEARRLALLAVELFADDERGGFFMAPAGADGLVARKKDLFDHPIPSGNSMLAFALLRLARIYGDDELERRAAGVLRLLGASLGRGPTEFAHALNALDLYLATPKEIAVAGPPESEIARAALEPFEPNAVVAFGPADDVPLLEGKTLVDGKPAVYVCERFACRAPVTEVAELRALG